MVILHGGWFFPFIHDFFFQINGSFLLIYLLAVPHGLWDLSILVPQAGIELTPPAVEAWSLNHRTARNVPCQVHFR